MQVAHRRAGRELSFDMLKFLSIAIIIVHHYQQETGAFFENAINWWGGSFYWGYLVEFFFILSGVFARGSIERIEGQGFIRFFTRKYLRFLPLLVICGIVCIFTKSFYANDLGALGEPFEPSLWNVVASLLGFERWFDDGLMINNPMWYVSVLLLCYIAQFVVTKLIVRWRKGRDGRISALMMVYGAMACIGLVMRMVCEASAMSFPLVNVYIGRGLFCFFLGLTLALAMERWSPQENRGCCALCVVAILAFVMAFCLSATLREHSDGNIFYGLLCLIIYPAVVILAKNDAVERLCQRIPFKGIGATSYDMYTWHLPLLFAYLSVFTMTGMTTTTPLAMYGFLILMVPVGWLSSRFIDGPISKALAKLILGS